MPETTERRQRGLEMWERVTQKTPTQPKDPFTTAIVNFISAEVWSRPGLGTRDRRWISLTCAAIAAQPIPIKSLIRSSLLSGDISEEELREFVLHLACYAGWPLASFVNSTLDEVVSEAD